MLVPRFRAQYYIPVYADLHELVSWRGCYSVLHERICYVRCLLCHEPSYRYCHSGNALAHGHKTTRCKQEESPVARNFPLGQLVCLFRKSAPIHLLTQVSICVVGVIHLVYIALLPSMWEADSTSKSRLRFSLISLLIAT